MKLKQKIAEFHKWQRKPTQFTHDPTLQNHCQCCGEDYRGNFCPVCGQPAGKGDVSWSSIKDGFMELWGMHTRSLLRSLWQLILRPGYFIAEYISGRRQVSFPPVKMLVIMALVILLITDFFSYDIDEVVTPITPGDVKSTVNHYSDIILNWAASHYDWACLVFLSFLIFPT
ncbi:MAG: DUF3667 domain-containing protein, partial [Muribaculaceae bacterium]|nr:DUF3667 domain-containing protein [Muribaculaceae bacterium]